jgi:hypothetical protein
VRQRDGMAQARTGPGRPKIPVDDKRDKRLVVYVEEWLFDWLAEQATERDCTISALVHQRLFEWMDER